MTPEQWESEHKYFAVDPCIAAEIITLINHGIRTVASCCGHGTIYPTVCVDEESIDKMEFLLYPHDKSYRGRRDIFILNRYKMYFDPLDQLTDNYSLGPNY
jgi:hypothetical protein